MSKTNFPNEAIEGYLGNVREIKVKGEIKTDVELVNYIPNKEYTTTSQGLTFTLSNNKIRISGKYTGTQYDKSFSTSQYSPSISDNLTNGAEYRFAVKENVNTYGDEYRIYLANDYISNKDGQYCQIIKQQTYSGWYQITVSLSNIYQNKYVDLDLDISITEHEENDSNYLSGLTGTYNIDNVNVELNGDIVSFSGTTGSGTSGEITLNKQIILNEGIYYLRFERVSGNKSIYANQADIKQDDELVGQYYSIFNGYKAYTNGISCSVETKLLINKITFILPTNTELNDVFKIALYKEDLSQTSVGNTIIVIGEGDSVISTNPQILDFSVDEKSNIYYESMPFSELSIDVDNTEGYFSDFTGTSIVNQLNKDCYIDFYLNVNETGWFKSWTMQYDSLKADNQKAKLKFKPYCSSIYDSLLYDKNKYFLNYQEWIMERFSQYMQDNYGVVLDEGDTSQIAIIMNPTKFRAPKDILLYYGTLLSGLSKPQMLCITDNNKFDYRTLISDGVNLTIPYNYLLEKPLITKELLEGVIQTGRMIKSYSTDTHNLQKQISSTFNNSTEVIVVYGEDYDLNNVSSNDITITNGTLVSVNHSIGTQSHYLIIEITGNVGDYYTIDINADLPMANETSETKTIYSKNNNVNTENFFKLTDLSFVSSINYWKYLVDNLEKKITFKIPALPTLQVGDILKIYNENNINYEIYIIAEIHTKWSSGFIMEIIAYKVNE